MEQPRSSIPTPAKGTGIPRLSKLPLPRSFPASTSTADGSVVPPSPTVRTSSLGPRPVKPPLSRPGSIIATSKIKPVAGTPRPSVATSSIKRPTSSASQISNVSTHVRRPSSRPASRLAMQRQQSSAASRPVNPEDEKLDQLGSLDGFRSSSRMSQRDGDPSPPLPQEPLVSPQEERTPKPKRTSRPSLSDRTIESLSQLPATPGTNRRKSSFFVPQSPMAPPSRPASAMSAYVRPGTSDGNFARPASPAKRIPASAKASNRTSVDYSSKLSTPSRPSVSAALPKRTSTIPSTPNATPRPAFSSTQTQANSSRGKLALRQPNAGKTVATPIARSLNSGAIPKRSAVKPQSENVPVETGVKVTEKLANSSAALRDQIAKARAAKRTAATKQDSSQAVGSSTFDFDLDADPFNQVPKDRKGLLRKRIDAARADGRLNIAAMGLKAVPDEVLTMYDADQMEHSKISWSETVDLTRFDASNNVFEDIPDNVFPDIDRETAAMGEDSKGLQFGGLEVLDLHANMLQTVPVGIRRLEMLAALNVVRRYISMPNEHFADHRPVTQQAHQLGSGYHKPDTDIERVAAQLQQSQR